MAKIVYFIQSGAGGPIKIGTSRNLKVRMADLQVGSYHHLILLATVDGDHKLERELHKRFADHRIRGEWFRPVDELLDFIEGTISYQELHGDDGPLSE